MCQLQLLQGGVSGEQDSFLSGNVVICINVPEGVLRYIRGKNVNRKEVQYREGEAKEQNFDNL